MKIEDFVHLLGADFYTGVPDSLLRPFCDYLYEAYGVNNKHHIVAANEGNAAAIGAGYYLATGKAPVVYLQNSGEGNVINPLASLLSDEVYGIPVLFIIGWRGEPGIPDEPQHVQQGKVTLKLLETMEVPYVVVGQDMTAKELQIQLHPLRQSMERGRQAALVICKGALTNDKKVRHTNHNPLTREMVIHAVAEAAHEDPIVSTTGKASRELFEYRERVGQGHEQDFLTVGSMGHSSSIALGLALQKNKERVWCIDGDGAALMHLGAMAVIGSVHPDNLIHVIIDNGAHESVGGMPTAAQDIELSIIAKGCGYDIIHEVSEIDGLRTALSSIRKEDGLRLLIAKAAIGARKDLGRPTTSPRDNRERFMKYIMDDCYR